MLRAVLWIVGLLFVMVGLRVGQRRQRRIQSGTLLLLLLRSLRCGVRCCIVVSVVIVAAACGWLLRGGALRRALC